MKDTDVRLTLCRVRQIWGGRPHAAFTSLTWWRDRWLCVFREGDTHSTLDGRIRVISSADGVGWESSAELTSPFGDLPDLRDPKILAAPDGQLMLIAAAAYRADGASRHRSLVWRSADGALWGEPTPALADDLWMWGAGTDGADVLTTSYATGAGMRSAGVRLHRAPGFAPVATLCDDAQRPNETAIAVAAGQAVALVRRELKSPGSIERGGSSLLGHARAPYEEWTMRDTGVYIGGPALSILPSGAVLAGGRKMDPQPHTSLWHADPQTGELRELITLPSAGDTSYPGLVWHDERLWVSYYSSHEGPTSIYFAELELER